MCSLNFDLLLIMLIEKSMRYKSNFRLDIILNTFSNIFNGYEIKTIYNSTLTFSRQYRY